MRKPGVMAVLVSIAGLVASVGWGEASESDVSLADVPENVKRAALQKLPGLRLVEAEVERTNGKVLYELEGILDGKRYEIEVTEEGEIVEVEREDDEEIPISKVPLRASKAARAALPGAKLVEAEIVRNEQGLIYEIEATLEGKEYKIRVKPDGQVLKVEEETEDRDEG